MGKEILYIIWYRGPITRGGFTGKISYTLYSMSTYCTKVYCIYLYGTQYTGIGPVYIYSVQVQYKYIYRVATGFVYRYLYT